MTTPTEDLTLVTVLICGLCLGGAEGECHSPGCAFFICPAPTAEQAERLRIYRDGGEFYPPGSLRPWPPPSPPGDQLK